MSQILLNRRVILGLLLVSLCITGCANFRAYYNAYFNANKAFKKAAQLKKIRLKKNALDSVDVAPDEKAQYERAIAKASKVLELYSAKQNKYLPKSLFIIGESYLILKEYGRAIVKYEELEKAYPDFKQMPLVKFHKAKCLFYSASYPEAKRALLDFIESTTNPDFKLEAMLDYAKLEKLNNSESASLDVYEAMLKEKKMTPEFKAVILFEAAKIAFVTEQWEKCRTYSTSPEIKTLPVRIRFETDFLAARSFYLMGNKAGGQKELEAMLSNKLYTSYLPEAQIFLAQWYFANDKTHKKAIELLENVILMAPKTGYAAESYYRLGDYQLTILQNEKKAVENFDSSAACGDTLQFAKLSKERVKSLKKLFDYRENKYQGKPMAEIAREFYIAELFLFELNNPDSAVTHMNTIVADTSTDSLFSIKAAYARAYITDEFIKKESVSDSLYKYVLEHFPGTEYAKQAEYNLGKPPQVLTVSDLAHKLFLEAEALNSSGYDLIDKVIPAYQKVIDSYPLTDDAAKAQFVIAMLHERSIDESNPYSLHLAKISHAQVRNKYATSPYYPISHNKLLEAGIQPGDSIIYQPPIDSGKALVVDTLKAVTIIPVPDTSKINPKEIYEQENFLEEDVNSKETLDVGEEPASGDEYE